MQALLRYLKSAFLSNKKQYTSVDECPFKLGDRVWASSKYNQGTYCAKVVVGLTNDGLMLADSLSDSCSELFRYHNVLRRKIFSESDGVRHALRAATNDQLKEEQARREMERVQAIGQLNLKP